MNLSEITTPAQLQEENNKPVYSVEEHFEFIQGLNPEQTLHLSKFLVEKLRKLHVNVSMKDNTENPQAWACDAGILAVALNCLQQIEL